MAIVASPLLIYTANASPPPSPNHSPSVSVLVFVVVRRYHRLPSPMHCLIVVLLTVIVVLLIFGLRFRKRGKPQEGLRKEKKEADSKTAILILGKNKGQPYLTSNFFYGCHPYLWLQMIKCDHFLSSFV